MGQATAEKQVGLKNVLISPGAAGFLAGKEYE
jgi:hypothetical protein